VEIKKSSELLIFRLSPDIWSFLKSWVLYLDSRLEVAFSLNIKLLECFCFVLLLNW
jgi:hypothetical protein